MTKEQEQLRKEIEAITDPKVIAKINDFIEGLVGYQESGNKGKEGVNEMNKPYDLIEECKFIVIKTSEGRPIACFKEYKNAELFMESNHYDKTEYEIVEAEKTVEE